MQEIQADALRAMWPRDVRLEFSIETGHAQLYVDFGQQVYYVHLPLELEQAPSVAEQVCTLQTINTIWSRLYEDEQIERQIRQERERFVWTLAEMNPDSATYRNLYAAMHQRMEQIRWEHYRRRQQSDGYVIERNRQSTLRLVASSEITLVDSPEQVQFLPQEQYQGMTESYGADQLAYAQQRHLAAMAQMAAYAQISAEQFYRLYGGYVGVDRGQSSSEAQQRGEQLLRGCLSPAQLKHYEAERQFLVIGQSTGKFYLIAFGRQLNIHELNRNGEPRRTWCFLPQGGLCEADVMLAQKIALENEEPAALGVANKFHPHIHRTVARKWLAELASETTQAQPRGTVAIPERQVPEPVKKWRICPWNW